MSAPPPILNQPLLDCTSTTTELTTYSTGFHGREELKMDEVFQFVFMSFTEENAKLSHSPPPTRRTYYGAISVYDTLVQAIPTKNGESSRCLDVEIPITLPGLVTTELSYSFAADTATAFSTVTPLKLCHLPPLKVRLVLSHLYPILEPPTIISLGAPLGVESHQWLSKRSRIQIEQRIVDMWSEDREAAGEGSGVIWRWWEWIGSGEFLSDLGLLQGDTLRLQPGANTLMSTFYTALKAYDASQTQFDFARTAFSCGICLEDRKGKSCIQMPGCGCVLYVCPHPDITSRLELTSSCVPCLSAGWTLAITEGSLENVFCPSVVCTKERATKEGKTDHGDKGITPAVVESVVGKLLRER
ncbi:hypothetical protein K3495_g13158, partial [Podosphaera aphanis]